MIKKFPKKEVNFWYFKDIYTDSLAGISLDLAQQELLRDKQGKQTIIAILDTPININHEYIENAIWTNKNEIRNNGIDDDRNGYIDDIHGWNFLGNQSGQNISFMKMEYTRIIKKYDSLFIDKNYDDIKPKDTDNYELYLKAKKYYSDMLKQSKEYEKYYSMVFNAYHKAKKQLSPYLKNDFSKSKLDSLKKKHLDNKSVQDAIFNINTFTSYTSEEEINLGYLIYTNHIKVLLNIDYDERATMADNPDNLNDKYYGNNIVNHNLDVLTHGTRIISPIINSQTQNDSIRGISSYNKIMPICISGYGDEHDKDIALGIRYAVDNGAKVINISFGKELSLYKQWVFDAFKYAEKNNVLIVSSSGNNSLNLNEINDYYPNDNINNGQEVSKNFLLVGASSYIMNDNLVCNFSNYGNIDVDIFAPGDMIRTTITNNNYIDEKGTSMASAITSGIAGLIFSYYPNLTASEVKQIIMESGTSYDIMVNKPSLSKEKELVPFSSLSKSGKIVNAYNALLMAEEVSKKKKRKK
ncbi:S8 family serine peptidase [Kordia sp.]|uniref:S8 family serine peptidase n=1 Tax=Kordia sp. TaxID=1965332 RepID=UPI003D27741C